MRLEGELIYLRALEPEDLGYIFNVENNTDLWEVSHTQTPYSRFLIQQYLENAHQDIYEAKQLRLVIVEKATGAAIGLIDLFDFDPKNERVGMGIVITEDRNRSKGFASEAIEILIAYVFNYLHCYQIYVNIETENVASIHLFSKFGFECIGIKKAWNRTGNKRKDEAIYQLINHQ